MALIDELITHDGRSRAGLFARLAVDGLALRIARTATAWTAVAVLATTGVGGLAVADFAAASAQQNSPRTVTAVAPVPRAHQTRTTRLGHAHTASHPAQKLARQNNSIRPARSGDPERSDRNQSLAR
ncbi:MAG TPA: hypothetical protein VGH56_11345 [Solirubrobacteraceae bacterium]